MRERQSSVRTNLVRIAAKTPGVVLIDPNKALCDERACAVTADGELLYFDDNHLSITGAARVVESELRPYFESGE